MKKLVFWTFLCYILYCTLIKSKDSFDIIIGQINPKRNTDFNDIMMRNETSKPVKNGKICGRIFFEKIYKKV